MSQSGSTGWETTVELPEVAKMLSGYDQELVSALLENLPREYKQTDLPFWYMGDSDDNGTPITQIILTPDTYRQIQNGQVSVPHIAIRRSRHGPNYSDISMKQIAINRTEPLQILFQNLIRACFTNERGANRLPGVEINIRDNEDTLFSLSLLAMYGPGGIALTQLYGVAGMVYVEETRNYMQRYIEALRVLINLAEDNVNSDGFDKDEVLEHLLQCYGFIPRPQIYKPLWDDLRYQTSQLAIDLRPGWVGEQITYIRTGEIKARWLHRMRARFDSIPNIKNEEWASSPPVISMYGTDYPLRKSFPLIPMMLERLSEREEISELQKSIDWNFIVSLLRFLPYDGHIKRASQSGLISIKTDAMLATHLRALMDRDIDELLRAPIDPAVDLVRTIRTQQGINRIHIQILLLRGVLNVFKSINLSQKEQVIIRPKDLQQATSLLELLITCLDEVLVIPTTRMHLEQIGLQPPQ